MVTTRSSCATCKDRALLCDKTVPVCLTCQRAKRTCRGYGLRLFWPNAGDGRRAILGKPLPSHKYRPQHSTEVHLVNVSSGDIEMYYHLTGLVPKRYARPNIPVPMTFSPFRLEVGDRDLFQYFQCAASESLATFGYEPKNVGNTLVRIALASNTPSARAVLQSLLALSSLHRHGLQTQAVELKISALRALSAASRSNIGTMEAIQHVATGMLLCSFEIHQASSTSSQWAWYISGIKQVISAADLFNFRDSDLATLMDWAYYHDVLARFTLRHWNAETAMIQYMQRACTKAVRSVVPFTFPMLNLLGDVCDTVPLNPAHISVEESHGFTNVLKILDFRIRSIPLSTVGDGNTTSLGELYQLAILVYFTRITGRLLDQKDRIQERTDKAFAIFSQMQSCERQFPVFILGCEARTDDQRAIILDLISRTERKISSRSFNYVRLLLQAVWAQDDLAVDREISYWDKLSSVMSRCEIMPTFA